MLHDENEYEHAAQEAREALLVQAMEDGDFSDTEGAAPLVLHTEDEYSLAQQERLLVQPMDDLHLGVVASTLSVAPMTDQDFMNSLEDADPDEVGMVLMDEHEYELASEKSTQELHEALLDLDNDDVMDLPYEVPIDAPFDTADAPYETPVDMAVPYETPVDMDVPYETPVDMDDARLVRGSTASVCSVASRPSSVFESFDLGSMPRAQYEQQQQQAPAATLPKERPAEQQLEAPAATLRKERPALPAEPALPAVPAQAEPVSPSKPVKEMRAAELKKMLREYDVDYMDAPDVAALRVMAEALKGKPKPAPAPAVVPVSAYGTTADGAPRILEPEQAYSTTVDGAPNVLEPEQAYGTTEDALPNIPEPRAGQALGEQGAASSPAKVASVKQTQLRGAHATYQTVTLPASPRGKPPDKPKRAKKKAPSPTPAPISSATTLAPWAPTSASAALPAAATKLRYEAVSTTQLLTAQQRLAQQKVEAEAAASQATPVGATPAGKTAALTLEERQEKKRQQRRLRQEKVKRQKEEEAVANQLAAEAEKKRKREQDAALTRAGLNRPARHNQHAAPNAVDDPTQQSGSSAPRHDQNAAP